MFLISMKKQYA